MSRSNFSRARRDVVPRPCDDEAGEPLDVAHRERLASAQQLGENDGVIVFGVAGGVDERQRSLAGAAP